MIPVKFYRRKDKNLVLLQNQNLAMSTIYNLVISGLMRDRNGDYFIFETQRTVEYFEANGIEIQIVLIM
jgi:hypothetical protein